MQLNLSKMTCEEFVMLDEAIRPKVVYYGVAYARGGKPEDAVYDINGTEKITPIINECRKGPKASYWQKPEANVKIIF
jgi:acid stress chaperone HdeA